MAKIEVIYGRKVEKALICDAELKMTPLHLWGEYSGIILHLLHETNFRNAQADYVFRKICILAHHPQRLFFDPRYGPFVTYQDKVMTLAASMARVQHDKGYFTEKRFNKHGTSSHKRHEDMVLSRSDTRTTANLQESMPDDAIVKCDVQSIPANSWE